MAKSKKKQKFKDPLGIADIMLASVYVKAKRSDIESKAELNAKKPVLVQDMVISNITDNLQVLAAVDTEGWSAEAMAVMTAAFRAQTRLMEVVVADKQPKAKPAAK